MNPPNQQPTNHHHHQLDDPDRGSPMNLLWGLILTLLTFLLVVVFILSIDMFAEVSDNPPDDPDDPSSEVQDPGDEKDPTDTQKPDDEKDPSSDTQQPDKNPPVVDPSDKDYVITKAADIVTLNEDLLDSTYAALVDVAAHEIIAGKDYDTPIHTASITKVMTLLVACEQLTESDMAASIVIDQETVEEMVKAGASGNGLLVGEEMTVRDLLYAVALESDGVASVAIAKYIAGSEAQFVELMNKKARELKLVSTTFKNCTGLYHDEHRSTCREMARVMIAAMENETVKTLLSTKTYEVKSTNLRPNGREFTSTYFIGVVATYRDRGFQAQPANGTVIAAKTGWVGEESGYCLVTYFVDSQTGKAYVAMTADASGTQYYLRDHIMLYEDYTGR